MSAATSQVPDLVERARDGDGEAFARLYDRYVGRVYGYILTRVRDPDLAEDLTADVFLRALTGLPRFRWRGVDLGAWLLTIARNRVHDHFRSAPVRLVQPTDTIQEGSDGHDPAEVALAGQTADALSRALGLLKEEHRAVLLLRFTHGLSVVEAGAAMGRSTGAIKALQHRALKALAAVVQEDPALRAEVPA